MISIFRSWKNSWKGPEHLQVLKTAETNLKTKKFRSVSGPENVHPCSAWSVDSFDKPKSIECIPRIPVYNKPEIFYLK